MRIFVVEYITGGGLRTGELASDLLAEAETMVAALLEDLAVIPGLHILLSRDPRLPRPSLPLDIYTPAKDADVWQEWRRCLDRCDAVWPIMPETDGLLERISHLAVEVGCELIGSRPEAVRIAASKLHTYRHLERHGIDVVPTYTLADSIPAGVPRWVTKPDKGVGGEGIRIVDTLLPSDADADLLGAEDCVVQPYIAGLPASLCLLCYEGEARLLSVNKQLVAEVDGRFQVRAIHVNGLGQVNWYEELADSIASAMPQLWGYVGVDLICTQCGPVVLEVNPRLSLSYAGLHQVLGINPAMLVLRLLSEGRSVLADESWRPGGSMLLNLESPNVV